MKIHNYDEILRDSFGLWISGFFSAISGWNPNITFTEHKAAFFWMLEKLLVEKKYGFAHQMNSGIPVTTFGMLKLEAVPKRVFLVFARRVSRPPWTRHQVLATQPFFKILIR